MHCVLCIHSFLCAFYAPLNSVHGILLLPAKHTTGALG
jgi:hypothetical protein